MEHDYGFAPVLHPTDFSEGADAAFPYALYFAALFGGGLTALHVRVPDAPDPGPLPDPDEVFGRVSGWLAADGEDADAPAGPPEVERASRRSERPAEEILEHASETEAGMICMGTQGRRGLRRLVLGSVAERVIRRSPAPVFTVRQPVEGWGEAGPEAVVAAVDLSAMTGPALTWAALVAAAAGADLRAVHVIESPAGAAAAGRRQEIHRVFADVAPPGTEDVVLDVDVVPGEPVGRICDTAVEGDADLVVTATHGREGPSRLVLGSVAEAVVRRSPAPVLTVSEPPSGTG